VHLLPTQLLLDCCIVLLGLSRSLALSRGEMIGWLDVVYALVMGVFAGAVAIIATVAIERFGGIVGGVISSSPTTIIATAVGVAYVTQSTRSVTDAMFTIPTGMLIDVLVLLVWRQAPSVLPQEWSLTSKLASVVVASLLGWFALVCLVVFGVGHHAREHVSTIILGSVTAGIMLLVGLLTVFLQPLPAPKGVYSVSVGMHAARGLLAGSAIFVSGLLAKIDPIAAGFAASFPAIFTTTMVRCVALKQAINQVRDR